MSSEYTFKNYTWSIYVTRLNNDFNNRYILKMFAFKIVDNLNHWTCNYAKESTLRQSITGTHPLARGRK